MKKYFTLPLIALSVAAVPAIAQTSDAQGGYVHIRGGMADLNNPRFDIEDTSTNPNTDIETVARTNNAATLSGEFGHDFGDVRIGVEVAYARHKIRSLNFTALDGRPLPDDILEDTLADLGYSEDDLDGLEIAGNRVSSANGPFAKLRQVSVLANLVYDIPVGDSPLRPYVGAGVGGTFNNIKSFGESDGNFRFTWQVRAGLAYQLAEKVELTADYTYRNTGKGNLDLLDSDDVRFTLGRTKASIFQAGVRFGF